MEALTKTMESMMEKMDGFNKALHDVQVKADEKREQKEKQGVADPITQAEIKKLNERADTFEEKYLKAIEEKDSKMVAMYESVQEILAQKRVTAPVGNDTPGLEMIPQMVRGLSHGDWGYKGEHKNLQGMLRYAGDGPDRKKSLKDETATSGGAYLIPDEWSKQLKPSLTDALVFGKLPVITYNPSDGTVKFPKMSGGATAYIVGAVAALTESDPAFTQASMTPKKIGVLCPVDNALVRRADPMVEQILKNDMITVAGLAAEDQYIAGSGATNYLTGLENTASIQEVSMGTNGAKFSAADGFTSL